MTRLVCALLRGDERLPIGGCQVLPRGQSACAGTLRPLVLRVCPRTCLSLNLGGVITSRRPLSLRRLQGLQAVLLLQGSGGLLRPVEVVVNARLCPVLSDEIDDDVNVIVAVLADAVTEPA